MDLFERERLPLVRQVVPETLTIHVYSETTVRVNGPIPCAVGNTWTYTSHGVVVKQISIVGVEVINGEYWWSLSESFGPLRDKFTIRGDSIFSEAGLELVDVQDSALTYPAPDSNIPGLGDVTGNRTAVPLDSCTSAFYSCEECDYCVLTTRFDDQGFSSYNEEKFAMSPQVGLIWVYFEGGSGMSHWAYTYDLADYQLH